MVVAVAVKDGMRPDCWMGKDKMHSSLLVRGQLSVARVSSSSCWVSVEDGMGYQQNSIWQ